VVFSLFQNPSHDGAMTEIPVTDRTRIHRLPERQRTDARELHAILDTAYVAQVAFVRDGLPVVIPFSFARDGDSILIHGSSGGGIFLASPGGVDVAVGVTHLDGLVFARSLFDSSMNYRSAVIVGAARPVPNEEKEEALRVISEHLMPGRWDEVRPMTKRELAATTVLRVPLAEASVKVRDHSASEAADDGEDHRVWAGVVPLALVAGAAERSPMTAVDVALPPSVARFS
jgi:nitroimidazol reductase NimA-like FMN-containing flavoprotein (pyridoxamine 5'-phosphate oxidase superfamily)